MSDYFMNCGTKSAIKSRGVFDRDVNVELLVKYLNETPRQIESNIESVRLLCHRWYELITCGFNVVVSGPQSKFRLIETFSYMYLQSPKLQPKRSSKKNKQEADFNTRTFRLHGFTPISQEKFNHAVFNIIESRRVTENDINDLVEDMKEKQLHHVFLLHSFDLLYKECTSVCDLIFQLYDREPKFTHIILSIDHMYTTKILEKLKFRLKLIFYNVPYGESFLYEKTRAVCVIDSGGKGASNTADVLQGRLSLQSLKDVYQALQETCQKVMVYIMKHHLEKTEKLAAVESIEQEPTKKRSKSSVHSRTRAVSNTLSINTIMNTVALMTRAAVLRNHLSELKDHNIIETDESGNHIECLVGPSTCKKFLDYLESEKAIV